MIYSIKRDYVLRGWDKMAWVLVHRPDNRYKKLSWEEFQVLLLCDGQTDLVNYLTEEMQRVLKYLEDEGVIESCETGMYLEEQQFYHYYSNRFIHSALWSVTGRCNFRCRHCYMDAPQGSLGELTHEQAIGLIDQMAECGVLRVDITGGEPFIRNDFWQLVDHIQYRSMIIGKIYTNGWFLTKKVLDQFEKRDLRPELSISFDGWGWHDWMRGIEGAEEAALRAFQLCIQRGFLVDVEMCVHRGNQETIRKTVNFLSKIGVPMMRIGSVSFTSLWEHNAEGNVLNTREYLEIMLQYIPKFFEDGMPMELLLGGVISLHRGSKKYEIVSLKYDGTEKCADCLLCDTARYLCYISPEGRLLPCIPFTSCREQNKFPLIQDIGLRQGLNDSFYMDIVDTRVKDLLVSNAKCAACEHKYQCGGGCRAIALEQTGDLMGCDGDQCMLWEEGYVDRIRQVTEEAIAKYCTNDEGIL